MITGRPSSFTQEIADTICDRLANGETLRAICRDEGMPSKTSVMRWLNKDAAFRDQYARAREDQADHWADDIVGISEDRSADYITDPDGRVRSDNTGVNRSRLMVDTKKWLMARMAPKKYGDKLTTDVNATGDITVNYISGFRKPEPPKEGE